MEQPARHGGTRPDTAVFVAGDAAIFFPALVAIRSIQVHNPGRFDYFICFASADLTPRMRELLARYDIGFIAAEQLARIEEALILHKMNGDWPVEVFTNWLLPEELDRRGYAFSIKVDYDILCIHPYDDLHRMWPHAAIASGMPIKPRAVPAKAARLLQAELGIDPAEQCRVNAGFVVFNNSLCREHALAHRFLAACRILNRKMPRDRLYEQTAFGLVAGMVPGKIRPLPSRYNQRVIYCRKTHGLGTTIRNIHYISGWKPWRPLDSAAMIEITRLGFAILLFYRPIWLAFAAEVEGFAEFCPQAPYSEQDMLGVAMHVLVELKRLREEGQRAAPATEAPPG